MVPECQLKNRAFLIKKTNTNQEDTSIEVTIHTSAYDSKSLRFSILYILYIVTTTSVMHVDPINAENQN